MAPPHPGAHGSAAGGNRSLLLRGVGKSFPNVTALEDVELEIRPGEVLALVGENGAGKSTLLRILNGDYRADRGELVLDGKPTDFSAPRDAHHAGVRVIYQEPEIVPYVNVAENLFLGELPRRFPRRVQSRAVVRAAAERIDRLGFGDVLDPRKLGVELSASERQLVEIVRALGGDARFIAFDEPTSSLTDTEAKRLFEVIEGFRRRGIGVIYVSHRLPEVFQLADRIAVLRDGHLVATRPASEVDHDELIRLMVGRPLSSLPTAGGHVGEEVVLRVRDLSSEWLEEISFDLRRGEILGLAGLVGAGRSELAKALFGSAPIDSGEIEVAGERRDLRSAGGAMAAGLAYAPEDRKREALLLQRSVRENVSLAVLNRLRTARVLRLRRERELVGGLVERLRVKTPSLDQEVSTLSGGNQQKVVLARWLATRPQVLLLDEPTRGIDVGAKFEIYRLIDELAAGGLAILLISSDMQEILGLSDRIIVMHEGRLCGELSRSEANEERVLALAIAGPQGGRPEKVEAA